MYEGQLICVALPIVHEVRVETISPLCIVHVC